MSGAAVLPTMKPGATCSHTGLSKPECSCRACHLDQLHRHAPELLKRHPPKLDLDAPIVPLERYARASGISLPELRNRASQLEVRP